VVLLTVTVSAGVARASSTPITRGNAAAVASAVDLRPSDLPGYRHKFFDPTAQGLRDTAEIEKCEGGVPLSEALLNAHSPTFNGPGVGGTPEVASDVLVWPSAALADRAFAAVPATRGISCFDASFGAALRAKEPEGVSVTVHGAPLRSTVRGCDDTHADRIIATVHVEKPATELAPRRGATRLSDTVYIDQFGFVCGQVAVGFYVLAPTPSPSLERHIADLLVRRARRAAGLTATS
jgi:hypothetical protein